jgi:hypothetical protein
MDKWHTCETTHCRAGWVVHLAGEAGKELEKFFGTCLAAQIIYRESSPLKVGVNRFFDSNEVAMEDMKRLADAEKAQSELKLLHEMVLPCDVEVGNVILKKGVEVYTLYIRAMSLREQLGEYYKENKNLQAENAKLLEIKDLAYSERNKLVCALSKIFPSWMERHPDDDKDWDDDWRWIVFIDAPTGQLSWHIHDSEFSMFVHLRIKDGNSWDGHTTDEKYNRLQALSGKEG